MCVCVHYVDFYCKHEPLCLRTYAKSKCSIVSLLSILPNIVCTFSAFNIINISYELLSTLSVYGGTSVCLEVSISNVIPESLDICPQLHLKQISQSSGITLLIHTPPDTHWTTCTCTCTHSHMYMYTIVLILIMV